MSNFEKLVRQRAEEKFGRENLDAISRWVGYWTDTVARNEGLFTSFRSRIELELSGRTVLDIGCGTAGLSRMVTEEGGFYIGSDFFPIALEMSQALISDLPRANHATLLRLSGTDLPLATSSVDCITAFDIIEHLEGGTSWQLRFLEEVRRVLRPQGLLLLTTPNRLYPLEGHTLLHGPQYLPVFLADRYIRWKNPSFFKEYKTYGQVHLLTHWKMKKLLKQAGLRVVHDLPWGMDLEDYPLRERKRLERLRRVGLDWAATTGFWFSACRVEDWDDVRRRRKKEWLRV